MQPEMILYQPFSNHQLHMLDTHQILLFYHFYHSKENYTKLIQFLQKFSSGSVRFIRRRVILEITKDRITVILPKGVRVLLNQAFSTFFISFSLFWKLIVTISSTSVENTTPKTVNVTGSSQVNFWHKSKFWVSSWSYPYSLSFYQH